MKFAAAAEATLQPAATLPVNATQSTRWTRADPVRPSPWTNRNAAFNSGILSTVLATASADRVREPRGDFARLDDRGAPRHERGNRGDEREQQRKVPRADDPDERIRIELPPQRDVGQRPRGPLLPLLREGGAPRDPEVDRAQRCRELDPGQRPPYGVGPQRRRYPIPAFPPSRISRLQWRRTPARPDGPRPSQSGCETRRSEAKEEIWPDVVRGMRWSNN